MSDCDHGDDEGLGPSQGCNFNNLHNETGCRTWYSRTVFHCSRHDQCYRQEEQREWEDCQKSPRPPPRDCVCFDGGPGWRCRDGFCIDASDVCDGREHCPDGSDESTEAYLGCNLFPEENCTSYRGEKHSRCEADRTVCVPHHLSHQTSRPGDCRACGAASGGQWRCNSGTCIELGKVCDGVQHCEDGSDELRDTDYGGCRMFPHNQDCRLSHRGERYVRCEADSAVCVPESFLANNLSDPRDCRKCGGRGGGGEGEELQWRCDDGSCIPDSLYRDGSPDCLDGSDHRPLLLRWHHLLALSLAVLLFFIFFLALICQHDCDLKTERDTEMTPLQKDKDVPIKLIEVLENLLIVEDIKGLSPQQEAFIEESYKCVHQDPIQFFHLFMYLANRYESMSELKKIAQYLIYLEQVLHKSTKAEALKCWRYHLGDSAMSLKITSSVADQSDINYTVTETSKMVGRSCFRAWFNTVYIKGAIIFHIAEGTFFYLERMKNLSYVYIIYVALSDLSRDNLLDHIVEFSLFLVLAFQIGLVQIAHIFISAFHSKEILVKCCPKGCKDKPRCWKKLSIKMFSMVFFFLMPLLALAKFVYFNIKIMRERRKLVTEKTNRGKVTIYKTYQELEKNILTYKKIYSYYRVTSAILESVASAFFFDFLVFVTRRTGRYRQFTELLQTRFYSFYGVEPAKDTVEFFLPLNRTGYLIFYCSIAYSVVIVLSALLKYWENVKNLGLSFWSKVHLIGYLTFIIWNEHWTSLSIFGATESFSVSGSVSLATLPICHLLLGIRILLICYIRHDQEWFNLKIFPAFCSCSRTKTNTEETDWAEGNIVEKAVNVISNCLAVTPFSVYKEPIEVLEKIQSQMESSDNEIRKEILLMWWQNPIKKLSQRSVRFIKRELAKKEIHENENTIRDILLELIKDEKVNSPLINTVKLDRDFGGLFIIVLIKNIVSLIIELVTREIVATEVRQQIKLGGMV